MKNYKKYMIASMIATSLLLGACGNTDIDSDDGGQSDAQEERVLTTQNNTVLVTYSTACSYCDDTQPLLETVVTLTTDGVITIEKVCYNFEIAEEDQIMASKTLTTEEYEAAYEYFSESDLLASDGDFGEPDSCDGGDCYLDFTLEDGSVFRTGGLNPHDEVFRDCSDYLFSFVSDDMYSEIAEEQEAYLAQFEDID